MENLRVPCIKLFQFTSRCASFDVLRFARGKKKKNHNGTRDVLERLIRGTDQPRAPSLASRHGRIPQRILAILLAFYFHLRIIHI